MENDKLREKWMNYDPDKDHNGAIGLELANEGWQRFGGDTTKIRLWFSKGEERMQESLEEITFYKEFLEKAEEIPNYQTINMGRCLEEHFPEIYSEDGKKPLKGKRLSEVKQEFNYRKSYIRSKLKRLEGR